MSNHEQNAGNTPLPISSSVADAATQKRETAKPTQGPWKLDLRSFYCSLSDVNGQILAEIELSPIDNLPECQANARLIAAAPDLLEACRTALAAKPLRVQSQLAAAIAKAEPEATDETP